MSNTEWKKGYEEGFAAGWKAAKKNSEYTYVNLPKTYATANPTGSYSSMAGPAGSYTINLNENNKTIRNLTDHTRIV